MKLSGTDKQVILTYAECNMRVSNTSRALYMSRSNVDYHLEKVRLETGLNPKCFYSLIKLVDMCH